MVARVFDQIFSSILINTNKLIDNYSNRNKGCRTKLSSPNSHLEYFRIPKCRISKRKARNKFQLPPLQTRAIFIRRRELGRLDSLWCEIWIQTGAGRRGSWKNKKCRGKFRCRLSFYLRTDTPRRVSLSLFLWKSFFYATTTAILSQIRATFLPP